MKRGIRRSIVVWALGFGSAATAGAAVLPAGTRLDLQLRTHVSSRRSRPGDGVAAVLVAPVAVDGRMALPEGSPFRGYVHEAGRRQGRASVRVEFSELTDAAGVPHPIATRLVAVDDAHEAVADDGRIIGVKPLGRLPSPLETLAMLLVHAHPVALATYTASRLTLRAAQHTAIDYAPGVELTLILQAPVEVSSPPPEPSDRSPTFDPGDPFLRTVADKAPRRTHCPRFDRPSDPTNVLFVGSQTELVGVFAEAGWARARPLGLRTWTRGLLALASRRRYQAAAVSRLDLDGRPPDLVFEKQNDTLARRHHVRVWRWGQDAAGQPVWVGAASHDVAIVFDKRDRAFTHRIEPQIDAERTRIVNELRLTGRVTGSLLVERPDVPRRCENATGDPIETDGRMAVVVLQPPTVVAHVTAVGTSNPPARDASSYGP